jgi:polar amino acid transport system substrate-binding protein
MDRAFPRRGLRLGTLTTVLVVVLLASACSKKTPTTGGTTPTASGSVAIVKDDTIAAEVPADIASKGALVIAVDASYAPNEFFAADNTTLQGWDIDLGHAIGTVLGIQFNFENASFDGIIPGLASGKYDVGMSSFTDNTEREQTVDFVTYFSAGTSFYVNASGGPAIATLDDLCGHSVAVEKGTTQLDDATAQDATCKTAGKPGVNVLAFPDQNGANLALSSGRAEVGMADSPVAAYQVQLSNGTFKLSGDAYGVAPYGIAIPRPAGAAAGTGPMSKPILDALTKLISTGAYLQILTNWGVEAGAITTPVINGASG